MLAVKDTQPDGEHHTDAKRDTLAKPDADTLWHGYAQRHGDAVSHADFFNNWDAELEPDAFGHHDAFADAFRDADCLFHGVSQRFRYLIGLFNAQLDAHVVGDSLAEPDALHER